MSEDTFDISMLDRDADLVATVARADALFGLLRRTVRVPTGWSALVIGAEESRFTVESGRDIATADTVEVLFVRTGATRLTFDVASVSSADAYVCDVSLSLSVEVSGAAADMAAFRSALAGTSDRVPSATLHKYLGDDVRRGLTALTRERPAAELVDTPDTEATQAAIRQACAEPCFSAGLRLVGEVTAVFTSSAYEATRSRAEQTAVQRDRMALQEQLRQAGTAARQQHLRQIEETLAKLQEMAQASPDVSVVELIRQFGQDQRGELYRSLLRCGPKTRFCGMLVVAAGDELIWLDPDALDRPVHRQRMDPALGGVRSVRLIRHPDGRDLLAVGSSTAVTLADPSDGSIHSTLSWPVPQDRSVRGGVNSVCVAGRSILATHSELGVCIWPVDPPGDGSILLADATGSSRTVRHIQSDVDGRVWLSIDRAVLCISGDDLAAATPVRYGGNDEAITSLTIGRGDVYAGTAAGRILHWPVGAPDSCQVVYSGGAGSCRSVGVADVMGVRRLGLTDGSDAVKELTIGDTVLDRYVAGGSHLLQAWWSDDRVAAVDDLRIHVHVWSVGCPDSPTGTADIGRMCSNRAQDVCMLPR